MLDVLSWLKAIHSLMTGTGVNTLDKGPSNTTYYGLAGTRFLSADQSASAAAVTSAPPANEFLVVTDITVSCGADMTVNFTEETSGDVILTLYMPENSVLQYTPRGRIRLKVANKRLMVQTSVAGNIAVTANYHYEV